MKLSVANKASITTGSTVNKVDFNHKKSQNASLTSVYSVDSDHDTKLLTKNEAKRLSHFGDIKKWNNLIGQEN